MKSSLAFILCFGVIFAGHIPESRIHHQLSKEARLRHSVLADEAAEVLKLIENGVNVMVRFVDGHTPLHLGSLFGFTRTTEILANHTTDIDIVNEEGLTSLYIAVQHGRTRVTEILLKKGANANFQEVTTGKTSLHIAAEFGYNSIAESLIRNHADVNIKDKNDQTPLDIAINKGYKSISALLILNGARFEIGGWKSTVLTCIGRKGDRRVNQTLVKMGVDVEESWATTLKQSINEGDLNATRLIIKNCVDDLKKVQSPWPLHLASYKGNEAILRMLIGSGGDVNCKDEFGNTPLHWAAYNGQSNIALILIENGAEVNTKDLKGYTSLHMCARDGKAEFARLLIEHGADIDAKTNLKGNTPLHWAAYYGHADVVRVLLDSNADVNIKNNAGLTPINFAKSNGMNKIVSLFDVGNKEILD